MKIKIQQFLRQNHSWSICGWNWARSLIKKGHDVHLYPTDLDKKDHIPADLQPYVKQYTDPRRLLINDTFDCNISYTAPLNWRHYLQHGKKNRFAIWAFEFFSEKNILPTGYAKYYQHTDLILPPSNYVKEIFRNSGIPEDHMVVVPHGIHLEDYQNKTKYPLQTKKKFKIGLALGQLHRRKNAKGLLKAYFKAFSKDDDVCLVLKVQSQKQQQKANMHQFDEDFYTVYNGLKEKYKDRGEVELVTTFIPDMIEFYNSLDCLFSMTNCEGFGMPFLEMAGANKLVIVPRHGGQLDFLNDNNSLLIDGKIVRAPRNYLYWEASSYAEMFQPSIDDGAAKLRYAYENYDDLMEKFSPEMKKTAEKFTWDDAVEKILNLT